MDRKANYLILTNNPLVFRCLKEQYLLDYRPRAMHREILIAARDAVYVGHALYTHPLSGSVKPNEMPYKSVVISRMPCKCSVYHAEIIANAVAAYDKFRRIDCQLPRESLGDLQLIDYTLLCSGGGFDAMKDLGIVRRQATNKGGVPFEIGTGIYSNR